MESPLSLEGLGSLLLLGTVEFAYFFLYRLFLVDGLGTTTAMAVVGSFTVIHGFQS